MAMHEASVRPGVAVDALGKVETRGIDYIPSIERHSGPIDLVWTFVSVQFCFTIVLFGSFPLLFGLSWWASVVAITLGLAIGSALVGILSITGPKTGTNQSVTSGAFFGIHGRLFGAAISFLIDIGFCAIVAWTTGQAFVDGMHRLFSTPTGNVSLTIGMAIATIFMILLGWLGHATLVASYKFVAITSGLLQVVMLIAFAPHFHAVSGGQYALPGGFWPSFMLALTTSASIPLGYSTWPNDYGRYVPEATPSRVMGLAGGLGMFFGTWFALLTGAFITASFKDMGTPFVDGAFSVAPLWLVPVLIIYGFTGNVVNGAEGVYNSALDLHSLLFFLRRSVVTLIIGAVIVLLAYFGVIVFNAINTIDNFVVIMTTIITAWVMINIIGYVQRRGRFDKVDLHAFAIPGARGRYWFTNGLNFRATGALAAGIVVGLMFTTTSTFSGPLGPKVGGVDLSFTSAGVVAAVVYVALLALFPERNVIPTPEEEQASAERVERLEATPVPS